MLSIELQKTLQSYDDFYNRHGISEELINAYVLASQVAIEEDVTDGLVVSEKAKALIRQFVNLQTGGELIDLEVFASDNKTEYKIINDYYDVVGAEAPYLVDSFFAYIECDEKDPYKRFYLPRRERLKPIITAYQEVYDGKLDFLSVSQPKRTGKCLVNGTLVATPYGFAKIEDLKVGDLVITASGKATKVLGVYPQEEKKRIYEVEFTESGKSQQKTIIECCEEHLWEVSTEDSRYKRKPNRVLTTKELLNGTLKRGKDNHNNYAVDYIQPVDFAENEISIDPWLLGVLIGDGGFSSGNFTFSNSEKDVIEKVEEKIKTHGCQLKRINNYDYRITHGDLYKELSKVGLIGKKSESKFIPKNYLYNSAENRMELLRGLLDSDGYVGDTAIEYSTASAQLAKDVMFLVKSLGGKVNLSTEQAHYVKNEERIECKPKNRLCISFPKQIIPISSKKQLSKYNFKREKFYHFINDIRATDRYADMTCIEVEDDSCLYAVTDNFILTHNTTSGLRLSLMMGGRKPAGSIFATGKGEGLVKSFFGGINETFDDEAMYKRYLKVFPDAIKVGQNADELTIHLGKKRRFATFTCRPIDGSIVGNTEANVLLYIDDCVKNHEEARNRDRLEFLCEKVTDDVMGRRIEGTPIIIQGTKYSLYDPITHLQGKADELGWKWREVAVPALDPITDESNWEIIKEGKKIFTTDYYRKERMLVTEETWAAEFQQEPFEAKGRMFPSDKLNYFTELPIDKEPDAIMAACDCADKGEDSCSMPIAYVYGNDVFIVDVVFDNSGVEHTKPECANMLIKHNVKTVVFESNSAGEYFGRDVMALVKGLGGRCSDRYKYNCTNKITRMENARDNIIRDYYFLDKSKYERGSQYDKFMKEFTTMTRSGRVKHDDAPDSLALLENEMRKGTIASVEAVQNPFRMGVNTGW